MCDGKNSSKRDVVILSIKPKRPDYPTSQKYVSVNELLQEWDKLDAYYRGQLLKLTKSLSKKSKKHSSRSSSNSTSSSHKSNGKHSSKSSPVNHKKQSSVSSDQFTELFGDENLFYDDRGNDSRDIKNKLLHSKSLNSLFEDPLDGPTSKSRSRKNSLTTANTNNLLVSIPVLSVQQNKFGGDGESNIDSKRNNKPKLFYDNDDDEENRTYLSDDDDEKEAAGQEDKNFLSVPRDNFQVQYGTKQKTRVALLEGESSVSPRWIVPVLVAPYKPPTAQGLNGVQIQKILYHKNDSVNFASPTTTTARTPDKPPDNLNQFPPPVVTKSAKVSSNNSPVSTVSPRSSSVPTTANSTPAASDNNNATPKQTFRTPEPSPSPKSDQGSVKSSPSPTTAKPFSPPINSTSGSTLKRPISSDYQSNKHHHQHHNNHAKKPKLNGESGNGLFSNMPVSSSTYSSSNNGDVSETESYSSYSSYGKEGDNQKCGGNGSSSEHSSSSSSSSSSPKKTPTAINKTGKFLKPFAVAGEHQQRPGTSSSSVFVPPAGISITDRIIKKASMPQPELLERQRRRRLESNQRKSYAMQKGDEHEEKESIDLSMKSFEMIWNVPLLSPLRSP